MKINVTVEVPEGKYCTNESSCKFIRVRGIFMCGLYDRTLIGKPRTIVKCPECLAASKGEED